MGNDNNCGLILLVGLVAIGLLIDTQIQLNNIDNELIISTTTKNLSENDTINLINRLCAESTIISLDILIESCKAKNYQKFVMKSKQEVK